VTPHHSDDLVTLYHGDCREILATLDDASVDACVTDPPYELGFMCKRWDASGIAYDVAMWGDVLRVLKPGGHLLAFGGTRTYHRMTAAIEDAGFEIRDSIHWIYGSGFPKSLDVSKAIDKAAGAERKVVAVIPDRWAGKGHVLQRATQSARDEAHITAPQTEAAATWSGWGTALKPAHEPIVVARKPLNGTVADTVQAYGTGALNIDACRIPTDDGYERQWDRPMSTNIGATGGKYVTGNAQHTVDISANRPDGGRWPANLVLTHHPDCTDIECVADCPCAVLDVDEPDGPSRFFAQSRWATDESSIRYVAKPSRTERNAGMHHLPKEPKKQSSGEWAANNFTSLPMANTHPTVKPLELIRWLVRLVTPPGGTVLEPFAGSGTTLEAAIAENCQAIGIELTADYLPIIVGRITKPIQPTLGDV
jgi:DNA modification methylase